MVGTHGTGLCLPTVPSSVLPFPPSGPPVLSRHRGQARVLDPLKLKFRQL